MTRNFILISFLVLSLSNSSVSISEEKKPLQELQMSNDLSILTFNAGLFELKFLGIPVLRPTDFIEERLHIIPGEIKNLDPDIIAFQEVYEKKHQSYLIDKLSASYPYYCFNRNTSVKVNNGLLILSKYELQSCEFERYSSLGPIDERLVAEKGILKSTLLIPDWGEVIFTNIHPTSGGFLNAQDSDKINEIRESQISQALKLSSNSNIKNIIIVGDFNAGPEIAPENYEYLINQGFLDTYSEFCTDNGYPMKTTWDAKNILNIRGTHSESISQRIDHIFISEHIRTNIKNLDSKIVFSDSVLNIENIDVPLSDHYGVFTRLIK